MFKYTKNKVLVPESRNQDFTNGGTSFCKYTPLIFGLILGEDQKKVFPGIWLGFGQNTDLG